MALLRLVTFFCWLSLLVQVGMPSARAENAGTVNAVIGDESWYLTHQREPTDATESERIATHLWHVLPQLRGVDLPASEMRSRRVKLIEQMGAYNAAGHFPRNFDAPGRSPRFMDGSIQWHVTSNNGELQECVEDYVRGLQFRHRGIVSRQSEVKWTYRLLGRRVRVQKARVRPPSSN